MSFEEYIREKHQPVINKDALNVLSAIEPMGFDVMSWRSGLGFEAFTKANDNIDCSVEISKNGNRLYVLKISKENKKFVIRPYHYNNNKRKEVIICKKENLIAKEINKFILNLKNHHH